MSAQGLLDAVELEPDVAARACVIWLHGLGADGNDFVPIVPALGLDEKLAVRFVFPHAPRIPVSINNGFVMPAWYDIGDIDLEKRHDQVGVRRSAEAVKRLIERENQRGVPTSRIVLAGFSQGGAIALFTGVRYPERLAGVIGLSTYMVLADSLAAEATPANRDVPILMCHGTRDPMVGRQRGKGSADALKAAGYRVDWHEYPMQHEVVIEEIRLVGEFLTSVLG
ncbi:MAG TPA: dienelactone hydrolase family protein [Planctomycetota bacterium]|nr:dienelactone hydrolase family protein [Planctomycetota bacterium]